MFLCWSIMHITERVFSFGFQVSGFKFRVSSFGFQVSMKKNLKPKTLNQKPKTWNLKPETYIVLASGIIGSLAFAFSDSFWFSAVEAEVYGASSFFTAVVFWAMLKWEEAADKPYANRWLILIAYLTGLSIGVHLLNLLAIPAMVLIYYFRKYEPSRNGVLLAILCAGLILGGILYGIIPWTVKFAGYFELLFINIFGMPYKTGVLVYIALLISAIVWGLWFTYTRRKVLLNTILLSVTVIIIGYSSYSMIVIRSLANPPMNQGAPSNVFSLMEYLNREQYGDRPLFYGPYFNAPEIQRIETTPVYAKLNGRYEIVDRRVKIKFDSRFCTLFPRMYSHDPSHIELYEFYGNITGRPIRVTREDGREEFLHKPTFWENMRFFVTYQLGHMYWRYFMWNFAGRQNDVQADGGILNGNWLSGIPFMDTPRIGPQHNLPEHMKNNPSRNRYFMIPLILGLIGLLWQLQRDVRYFWVVMTLFIMTGIAIVIYLNQTPLQPRERDYAYAGSFYAFAIWIGMGVAAIYDLLKRKIPAKAAAVAACIISISAPIIMAQQNYDDHDRSGRYTARDIAYNYLNSCAPNAILFTMGDNDTFPLWYLQEVEGIRTDVRVVNLQLLSADWYIRQMKRAVYDSPPLPIALTEDKYLRGRRNWIWARNDFQDTIPLRWALDFINSDDPHTKFIIDDPHMEIDYIMTRNFSIPVDRQKVLENGTVNPADADLIVDSLVFRIPSILTKGQWIALEIIAENNWERPIYWTSVRHSGTLGLDDFMQLDGITYRLVPIKTPSDNIINTGRIDTDILYDRLMNTFRWQGINDPNVWLCNYHLRTLSIVRARHAYTRLAMQLLVEDKPERAVEVLNRSLELFPAPKVPHDFFSLLQAEALYQAGMTERANTELFNYAEQLLNEIHYFYSLPQRFFESVQYNAGMNVELLAQIMDISESYGQEHISEHIRRSFER